MKPIHVHKQINFSVTLFLFSLGGGTILLLLLLLFPNEISLLLIGFFFLLIAIVLNAIMCLFLLYLYKIYPEERQKIVMHQFLLLSNIPVAALYIYLIFN